MIGKIKDAIVDTAEDIADNIQETIEDRADDLRDDLEDKIEDSKETLSAKKKPKFITWVIVVLLVIIAVMGGDLALRNRKGPNTTTEAESSLEDVKNIKKLYTLNIPFKGIARVYKNEKKKKIKYYVKYTGNVKYEVNLEELKVAKDSTDNNKYTITLPEPIAIPTISGREYLFEKDKYDVQGITAEANAACSENITAKLEEDASYKALAKENTEHYVRSFVDAILGPNSTIEYKIIWEAKNEENQ